MTEGRRMPDLVLRAGFSDELLARLARSAARRTALRKAATSATATATASVALLVATRRRSR